MVPVGLMSLRLMYVYRWIVIALLGLSMTLNVISASSKLPLSETTTAKLDAHPPEVYYINMDKSADRRKHMENQLLRMGLKYFRIRGNPWSEIYIPKDVLSLWWSAWCYLDTEEVVPSRAQVMANTSSHLRNYTSIMSGLCGRGHDKMGKEKNNIKELGCTTSHLLAMHRAIYSKTATSRYAIIIEDDVKLPFHIDFEELANSAPKGFGILQLFNSNKPTMMSTWKAYIADPKNGLWHKNANNLHYWSTCGYLIDREVMKPIIDKVVYNKDGWQYFKVIAGLEGPCSPRDCCIDGNDTRWGYWGGSVKFIRKPPCVSAAPGFQADSYIYSLADTYVLAVPLIANGKGGNASTFHQDHVELLHRAAFKQQRQLINMMLKGSVEPPPFARPALRMSLNESHI